MPIFSSLQSRPSLRVTALVARCQSTARPTKKTNNKKTAESSKIETNIAPEVDVAPKVPATLEATLDSKYPSYAGTTDASKLYKEFKKAKEFTQLFNFGVPILTPPVPRDKDEFTPFWGARGVTYRLSQTLPTLNAAAILDPRGYCQNSASAATSKSGTDAAKRLLRGKDELINVMKQELNKNRRPSSYLLKGHGIPEQLLQNHLNLADTLLRTHRNARLLSFNNTTGDLSFDVLRIRARDGGNTHASWDQDSIDECIDMELYLTVMNRLANHLSECLNWNNPPPVACDLENDDFTPTPMRTSPRPRRWNVDILRGSVFPNMEEELTPIIEWTPREGSLAPGHVCIRLQGAPNYTGESLRRKKKSPVTLVFDACYRNDECPNLAR